MAYGVLVPLVLVPLVLVLVLVLVLPAISPPPWPASKLPQLVEVKNQKPRSVAGRVVRQPSGWAVASARIFPQVRTGQAVRQPVRFG